MIASRLWRRSARPALRQAVVNRRNLLISSCGRRLGTGGCDDDIQKHQPITGRLRPLPTSTGCFLPFSVLSSGYMATYTRPPVAPLALQVAAYSTTASRYQSRKRPGVDDKKKKKSKDPADDVDPELLQMLDEMEKGPIKYFTINNNDNLSQEELAKIVQEEEERIAREAAEKFLPDWKPGKRRRPLFSAKSLEEFLYELEPEKHRPKWTALDKRCGALALKLGMMPVFDDWGIRHPCTVLHLDNNIVLGHKTPDKHGYTAVQVAAGQRKAKNVAKPLMGIYQEILPLLPDEQPPYMVREFRVSHTDHLLPLHSRIHARHFVPGQNLDVSGITKGKGFQGGMKRHGFGGMPASHGVSASHRALGSVGQCQDPGRVFKGKKMAGHMGVERVTVQNLRLIKVDCGRNLLFVEGAVPGNKGHFVEVRDAIKRPLWNTPKVLNQVDRPPVPTFEYDDQVDGCGLAGHDVFMPLPERDPFAPDLDEAA